MQTKSQSYSRASSHKARNEIHEGFFCELFSENLGQHTESRKHLRAEELTFLISHIFIKEDGRQKNESKINVWMFY